MKADLAEAVAKLEEVTAMQADVIAELFRLLGQHIAAEELDRLPAVDKINAAARVRAEVHL